MTGTFQEIVRICDEPTRILVVDDRPENLLAMEAILDRPPWTVISASSGSEALALMLEHTFAVVVLDVQMPEIDGFEVAELMRRNPRTRHTPLIFVTAISKEQSFVFRGYEAGAVDYLFKPVEPTILEAKVRTFCELHRQRRIIELQMAELCEQKRILEQQLAEIQLLRGMLPMCCHCKRIRDDDGFWEGVEVYVESRTDARFTHGICPDCLSVHYPDLADEEGTGEEEATPCCAPG